MNKLALPLNRRIADSPKTPVLPLALNRVLGSIDDIEIIIPDKPKPPKKRQMTLIGQDLTAYHTLAQKVAKCVQPTPKGRLIAGDYPLKTGDFRLISGDFRLKTVGFVPLFACSGFRNGLAYRLFYAQVLTVRQLDALSACQFMPISAIYAKNSTITVKNGIAYQHMHKQAFDVLPMQPLQTCNQHIQKGKAAHTCQLLKTQASVIVPCRFYPIAEDTQKDEGVRCRVRPKSSELPFTLNRKHHQKQRLSARALPLDLTCWHDIPTAKTPNLKSYITMNKITATIGGVQVSPLSFNIKTDVNSLYWQGQIEITAKDFAKIAQKIDKQRGKEAIISVTINKDTFVILCEDVAKNRQFINHSYTLSGRSVTAHLSAEYASGVDEVIEQSLYASQLVNHVLADLPFSCEFGVADWLIPKGSYATGDKTPIAVIGDVAAACAAFVLSDKAEAKLFIKPKYKKAAWELASGEADVTLPLDVIRQISQQRQAKARFNTVTLTSQTQGAFVFREHEGRDKEAPTYDNALYTDQACMIPAGIAILSDSGIHETVSITTRWADKYNLGLANLGDIWQINDKLADGTDDAWRAVVVSVSVDVKVDDGVPGVWQVVGLDRYLDV